MVIVTVVRVIGIEVVSGLVVVIDEMVVVVPVAGHAPEGEQNKADQPARG